MTTVHQAFGAVMADVKAIEKSDRNQQQGFRFRGIDAVMQEVGPVLRAHGVFIVPKPLDIRSETYETAKGTAMRNVTVTMEYTVFGPAGDSFVGGSYGEAADSGDKAVTKAQSVAYRTFLLTALTVPTGDVDPDAHAHERAAPSAPDPATMARVELGKVCKSLGLDPKVIGRRFASDYDVPLNSADAETITGFAAIIRDEHKAAEAVPNA